MKIHGRSSTTFSLAGWLFADMFLGLAMIFLLTNTRLESMPKVSEPTQTATVTPTVTNTFTPAPTASATPLAPTKTAKPLPTPQPGLDLTPHIFSIKVNPSLLVTNDTFEGEALKRAFADNLKDFNNRKAGLVITLGYHNIDNISYARQFADKANEILCQTYEDIFNCNNEHGGTVTKTFWWDANVLKPVGTLDFEIYYFNHE